MGEIGAECLDEDEVLAFVAGDLPSQRRTTVMAHVDGCETCRSLAAALAHDQPPRSDSQSGTLDVSVSDVELTGEAPPSLDGKKLIDGRFRLGKVLGKGAMGTVFRARDERLGTDVALKLVKRGGDAKSFARELHAGRRVTHPNVCRVYDAGSIDDYDYITMELIEGETLGELLMREDLAPRRAQAIIDGIAAGLAEAHAQGIVHRDLKPANVMIERGTARVVLTDFGVATDLLAGQSYRLVGTPQYWPPEQARGEPASTASDVYSLGVVAYRILTGRDLKLNEDDALADVPRAYRGVIERCIEHRPNDRYKDGALARAAFASAARSSQRFIGARGIMAIAALAAVGAVFYGFGIANPSGVRSEPAMQSASASAGASVSAGAGVSVSALSVVGSAAPPGFIVIEAPSLSSAATSTASTVSTRPAPLGPRVAAVVASSRPLASAAASAKPASSSRPPDSDILYVK